MKHFILTIVLIIPICSLGQSPWEVNTTAFEFSMNITGKVKLNNQAVQQANSYLAAFVNDECRGVIKATSLESGEHAYFLTIYSNLAQGEEITFKYADENSEITTFSQKVVFKADGIYGSPDDLFIWADPAEFETTELFNIWVESQVGEANIDKDQQTINLTTLSSDLGALKLMFNIPTGAEAYIQDEPILWGDTVNFLSPVQFTICGVDGQEKTWTILVEKSKTSTQKASSSHIKVYPTLVYHDCFYVEINEKLTYKLYSVNGKLMQEGQLYCGKNRVLMHDASSGGYILWLKVGKEQMSVKLFKN